MILDGNLLHCELAVHGFKELHMMFFLDFIEIDERNLEFGQ